MVVLMVLSYLIMDFNHWIIDYVLLVLDFIIGVYGIMGLIVLSNIMYVYMIEWIIGFDCIIGVYIMGYNWVFIWWDWTNYGYCITVFNNGIIVSNII